MKLPGYVTECLDALENAGFAAYAVGGCVRDAVLGLEPHDYDLCTAALPEQIQAVFPHRDLVLAGLKHGTVGVITDAGVVEITTFRTEGGYADSRHPDWVRFVPEVEEDLARRDFTVNAMAYSPRRGFRDPFGGREDLKNHILRAVGDPQQRFREDALRILRGARFAARFRLIPEENTEKAMVSLVPLLDHLARERVFEELCKLLMSVTTEDLLRFAPVIAGAIPELAPQIGFDQRTPYHAYDIFTHTAHVVNNMPRELTLRWTALLHDVGKPASFTVDERGQGHFKGHAAVGAEMADSILRRLKAPTALREEAVLLISQHMNWPAADKKLLRRWMSRLGPEMLDKLLTLQAGDTAGKGLLKEAEKEQIRQVRRIVEEIQAENACLTVKDLAVDGNDLMTLGFRGRAIGACLNALLEQVLDETLTNDRAALLDAAQRMTL